MDRIRNYRWQYGQELLADVVSRRDFDKHILRFEFKFRGRRVALTVDAENKTRVEPIETAEWLRRELSDWIFLAYDIQKLLQQTELDPRQKSLLISANAILEDLKTSDRQDLIDEIHQAKAMLEQYILAIAK